MDVSRAIKKKNGYGVFAIKLIAIEKQHARIPHMGDVSMLFFDYGYFNGALSGR